MKLIGFLLIVLSSVGCGFCFNTAKAHRLNDLTSFSVLLEHMQAELMSRYSTLPFIVEKMQLILEGKALEFCQKLSLGLEQLGSESLEDIWCRCLHGTETNLNQIELSALASIPQVLGKYDVENQAATIATVNKLLISSIEKEQRQLPQYKKTALGISASIGAMFAVLLI